MLPNEAEIKLQARMIAAPSPLSVDEAEYLIRLIDGNMKLLDQCEQLAKRSVSFACMTQWVEGKIGGVEPGSHAYTFCEAVLNLVANVSGSIKRPVHGLSGWNTKPGNMDAKLETDVQLGL